MSILLVLEEFFPLKKKYVNNVGKLMNSLCGANIP